MVKQIGNVRPVVETASPEFWDQLVGIGIQLIIIGIVFFIIVLIVRWFVDRKKEGKDIYTEDYKKTLELCKIHKNPKFLKSVGGLPSWVASSGVPVMIRYPSLNYSKQHQKQETTSNKSDNTNLTNIDNEIVASTTNLSPGGTYKLGTYAGSCHTHDGCFNLLVKSSRYKIMGIFPKLLVLKLRLPHIQKVPNAEDRKKTRKIEILPDSFSLSEDIILIDSLGLDKVGNYFYCVNMDDNGYIINTKPYVYQDMIEISTTRQLIDVGRNMAIVAEDWVRSNPLVQFVRKTDTGLTSD